MTRTRQSPEVMAARMIEPISPERRERIARQHGFMDQGDEPEPEMRTLTGWELARVVAWEVVCLGLFATAVFGLVALGGGK